MLQRWVWIVFAILWACREREPVEDFQVNPIVGVQPIAAQTVVAGRDVEIDVVLELRHPIWAQAELGLPTGADRLDASLDAPLDAMTSDSALAETAIADTGPEDANANDATVADVGVAHVSARFIQWRMYWSRWLLQQPPVLLDAPVGLTLTEVNVDAFPRIRLRLSTTEATERRVHEVTLRVHQSSARFVISVRGIPGELDTTFGENRIASALAQRLSPDCALGDLQVDAHGTVAAVHGCLISDHACVAVNTNPMRLACQSGTFPKWGLLRGDVVACTNNLLARPDANGVLTGDPSLANRTCGDLVPIPGGKVLTVPRAGMPLEVQVHAESDVQLLLVPESEARCQFASAAHASHDQVLLEVQCGDEYRQLTCVISEASCRTYARSRNLLVPGAGLVSVAVERVIAGAAAPIWLGSVASGGRSRSVIALWSEPGAAAAYTLPETHRLGSAFVTRDGEQLIGLEMPVQTLNWNPTETRTLYAWSTTTLERREVLQFDTGVASVAYDHVGHRLYVLTSAGLVRRYWL